MDITYDKIIQDKYVNICIKDGKYGLIDNIGEVITPPYYDDIYIEEVANNPSNDRVRVNRFSDKGLAKVKLNNHYGYINIYGIEILECKYNEAFLINDNLFNVRIGRFMTLVNSQNEVLFPLFDDIFSKWYNGYHELQKHYCIDEGLAIYKRHGKYGLLAPTKRLLTLAIYDDIQIEMLESTNMYIPVRQETKWGMLNCYGDLILPCIYDEIASWQSTNYSNDWNLIYHKVLINETFSESDTEYANYIAENWKLSPENDSWKSEDFQAYIKKGGCYGLVATWGREIVPCSYQSVEETKKAVEDSSNNLLTKHPF